MLNRSRELLRNSGDYLAAQVKLSNGETKEDRFASWLAEKTAMPRFCKSHPGQSLVIGTRSLRPAYRDTTNDVCYDPWAKRQPIPGMFEFGIRMFCPACRCAYALCPPGFHTTSFDSFDTSMPERAVGLARCREFAAQVNERGCGFALFVGKPGTGKTRLASNIVRELEDADALYTRQGELTVAQRAGYGRKDVYLHRRELSDEDGRQDEPPTPLNIVQRVRFLILDELGCNPLANDERLFLDELLKHRYDEHKPTVLISNLALDQLKDFVGDAIADRVKHASGNGRFIMQFSGESFRRSAGGDYLEGIG